MKRLILSIILLVSLSLLCASIITDITKWAEESNEMLIALGVTIGTAIAIYLKIREALSVKEAKDKLANIAKGLMTKAEEKPTQLLDMVTDAEKFPAILNKEVSPEVKESLVMQVFTERNPGLLKKAKLKDLPAIASFLGNVYQGIKPMIHLLRKK